MKTKTKIGIGLGIMTAAGVGVTMLVSEKLIKKAHHLSTRYKAKKFVQEKLGGNAKVLSILDKLSDDDLDSLMQIIEKIKSGRDKVSDYGEEMKDRAENMTDRFLSFIEEMHK